MDVLDHDATAKLEQWFKDRWGDKWCVDITKELIQVIDESWARPECPPPYHIYVKMAYHLAEEARAGLSEFTVPRTCAIPCWNFSPPPCASRPGIWRNAAGSSLATSSASAKLSWPPPWPVCSKTRHVPLKR